MTTTVDRPAVEVERITVKKATALLLAASERQHLPFPYGIRRNGPTSGMLCIDFESIAALDAWTDFFRIKLPEPYFHNGIQKLVVSQYGVNWQGWSVKLEAHDEPLPTEPELDAETVALIDEVTAEPAKRDDFEPYVVEADGSGCPMWRLGPDDVGTIHGAECRDGVPAGTLTPHVADSHAAQVRAEMVEALTRATSTLETYRPEAIGAALADGTIVAVGVTDAKRTIYALKLDPAVAIAEGREIDLTTVGGYFANKWPHLNILQRARLIKACDDAGWFGDWTACYRQVMGADSQAVADDAMLILSELDDIPVVSVTQLAEAAAGVEPDAEIAYVIAHRGEGAHYIDVLTDDPELADASRGGAGIARMTESTP